MAKKNNEAAPSKAKSKWPRRVNYVDERGTHLAVVEKVENEETGALTLSVFPAGGKNTQVKGVLNDDGKKPGTWHKIS